jgi:FtsH-binding integral membrane protein
VIFGIITVVYGLAIYYFLPLSMLSLNFKLILRIFFMILLGMLFGLTLLSFNLQRLLEIALTHTLLFFEQSSMRMLVLKNLTAHKLRNKMTSIIFSLAIGFIVFLIVSYNLQIKSSSLLNLKKQGTYLVLSTNTDNAISPTIFDPIIRRY